MYISTQIHRFSYRLIEREKSRIRPGPSLASVQRLFIAFKCIYIIATIKNNTMVLSGAAVEWTLSNINNNIQYSILVVHHHRLVQMSVCVCVCLRRETAVTTHPAFSNGVYLPDWVHRKYISTVSRSVWVMWVSHGVHKTSRGKSKRSRTSRSSQHRWKNPETGAVCFSSQSFGTS